MIARLSVLLPFDLFVLQGSELEPQQFDQEAYRVRIHPPCLAALRPAGVSVETTSISEIARALVPAVEQTVGTVLFDGKATVPANLLRVDFLKPSFDRRHASVVWRSDEEFLDSGDPSVRLAFNVANGWLSRYKYRFRSPTVRVIRPSDTFWCLRYLEDDESELPRDPSLFRMRMGGQHRVDVNVVSPEVWNCVGQIAPGSSPLAWEVLLLDAPAMLPDVGPAVVLAYAALEAFIDWALDGLAPTVNIPAALWEWLNTRDSFWLRPRTTEQFDILLRSLTGKSLTDEPKLWESFRNLASARHSYVHSGHARIGNERMDVTLSRATELVAAAAAIVGWIEALIPENLRRPKLDTSHSITVTARVVVAPIADPNA